MKKLILALPFLFPFAANAACPTTSLTFKEAAGATQTLCFGGASGSYTPQYQIMDSGGTNLLAVNASGQVAISNTAFTANAGTNLNTSLLALDTTVGTTNTDLGPPGATACATDTGSCSLNALMQRLAQRLTTINTTLGSPFQAGGALAANQSINLVQVAGASVATGHGTASGSIR